MSDHPIVMPNKFSWSPKFKALWSVFVLIGVATFLYALRGESQRAWANFLLDFFYWLSISLAGIFFAALQYLAGAKWSSPIRRVSETFIGYIPVAAILFVILLVFGVHHLYEWTDLALVAKDSLLLHKSPYLNLKFFTVHHILLFGVALVLGGAMVRNSFRQDENGNPKLTKMNARLSAPFILLFGWLFTFVSFDLIMSLDPHWYSTIFGIYCWGGLFYSGLAMITLWTIFLKKKGYLNHFVNENHLHDLGKLMFAFLVFWAYIGVSQFILIWYSNLPEEIVYMLVRVEGPWKKVSLLLAFGKFIVPFFLLLSRAAKRKENFLMFMTFWFLMAQWLDLYWLIFPTFFSTPIFGFVEIGMFLGFLGLFALSVGRVFSNVSPVAIRDPYLQEALHHHQ